MKEVPFPKPKLRRKPAARAPAPALALGWKAPNPFYISVEERRRTVLRERPVLFWRD